MNVPLYPAHHKCDGYPYTSTIHQNIHYKTLEGDVVFKDLGDVLGVDAGGEYLPVVRVYSDVTGPNGGTTLGWETYTPTYMYDEYGDATGFVLRVRDKTLASSLTHFLEATGVPDRDGVVTVTVTRVSIEPAITLETNVSALGTHLLPTAGRGLLVPHPTRFGSHPCRLRAALTLAGDDSRVVVPVSNAHYWAEYMTGDNVADALLFHGKPSLERLTPLVEGLSGGVLSMVRLETWWEPKHPLMEDETGKPRYGS